MVGRNWRRVDFFGGVNTRKYDSSPASFACSPPPMAPTPTLLRPVVVVTGASRFPVSRLECPAAR